PLEYVGNKIESFSKENPNNVPNKDLKEMTTVVNRANNFLKSIKEQPVPEIDERFLKGILKNIEKIKNKAEPASGEAKLHPKQKLVHALSQLGNHLTRLRQQQEEKITKVAPSMKMNDVKAGALRKKGTVQVDKDLNKHLSIVEKELNSLKATF